MMILISFVYTFIIVSIYLLGIRRGRKSIKSVQYEQRKSIYCAGWHDGLFYAIGEYDPKYYIEQRAIEGFENYESNFKEPEPN